MNFCIDAGHCGNWNPGAVDGYFEAKMTWSLSRYLGAELETYKDVSITYTRDLQEKDLALFDRGKMAKGANLFISLHSNGFDGTPAQLESTDYPVAYTMLDGSTDELGQKLADCVRDTIGTKQTGRIYHRHATDDVKREYYGVLRGAASVNVPGLILENSFHTNPTVCAWLMVDGNLRKLAANLAAVIAEHYQLEKIEPAPKMEIVNTPVKIGDKTINGILLNGVTFCPLRETVDTLCDQIKVDWTKKDGAFIRLGD